MHLYLPIILSLNDRQNSSNYLHNLPLHHLSSTDDTGTIRIPRQFRIHNSRLIRSEPLNKFPNSIRFKSQFGDVSSLEIHLKSWPIYLIDNRDWLTHPWLLEWNTQQRINLWFLSPSGRTHPMKDWNSLIFYNMATVLVSVTSNVCPLQLLQYYYYFQELKGKFFNYKTVITRYSAHSICCSALLSFAVDIANKSIFLATIFTLDFV